MADKKQDVVPDGWESSADIAASLDSEPRDKQPGSLKKADAVAGPDVSDADANDPPLRTNRPDVPVIGSLAKGAGEHKPLNDPEMDRDGRLRPDVLIEASRKESGR